MFSGKNLDDMGKASKKLEKDMAFLDIDDDDDGDVITFTPELAKLKAEAKGKKFENDDEDMDDEKLSDGEEAMDKETFDQYPEQFSDSEEEKEDFTIRKSDALIVCATADNDHSNLEVYVYEHENANMYVHHEIILSSYPLCLEWLSTWQG